MKKYLILSLFVLFSTNTCDKAANSVDEALLPLIGDWIFYRENPCILAPAFLDTIQIIYYTFNKNSTYSRTDEYPIGCIGGKYVLPMRRIGTYIFRNDTIVLNERGNRSDESIRKILYDVKITDNTLTCTDSAYHEVQIFYKQVKN